MKWIRLAGGVAFSIALLPGTASGQHPYELLHSFVEPAFPPMGRLVEASNGRFYGVARNAGGFNRGGVIAYDRQPDGTLASTVIHSFNGADGASPQSALVQGSDGALYGCASGGGASDNGTIYRVAPDGTFALLQSLGTAPFVGPCAELTAASDGHLYGMSGSTVFRMTTAGAMTPLAAVAGGWPADVEGVVQGGLIDGGDGKLYGINSAGQGQIFSVTFDGTVEVLHSFSFFMGPFGATGELNPRSFIDGRDGFFYGTTSTTEQQFGGAVSKVFRISRAGVFSIIFTGSAAFPHQMGNLVRGSDGNFYGTTRAGGTNNQGQLFRLTPVGAMTTIHSFQYVYGAVPNSLMQSADGTLWGSNEVGGFTRRGAIFRSTTGGQHSAMHMFPGADPLLPASQMLTGPDGAVYGSSCGGGTLNAGTIFRLTENGTLLTVLHSFAYWDGGCPSGALAFGADGALYGTAQTYGLGGRGTIFRITTAGVFSVVRFFSGADGAQPLGGLLRASDGNFYGTTRYGGGNNAGTIFRLSGTGVFTTLYSFSDASGTAVPSYTPLIQLAAGNIYGARFETPFRMTLAGVVTHFTPVGIVVGLTPGSDGTIYGTTFNLGGPSGTIFRMTADGASTVLHEFTGTYGQGPYSALLQHPTGAFYGSMGNGGTFGHGTLFEFASGGVPTTIHEFSGTDGSVPFSALTLGPTGVLLGSTLWGGDGGRGVIFRLTLPQ